MNVHYSVNIGCELRFIKKPHNCINIGLILWPDLNFLMSENGQWIKTCSACVFDRWEEAGDLKMIDWVNSEYSLNYAIPIYENLKLWNLLTRVFIFPKFYGCEICQFVVQWPCSLDVQGLYSRGNDSDVLPSFSVLSPLTFWYTHHHLFLIFSCILWMHFLSSCHVFHL